MTLLEVMLLYSFKNWPSVPTCKTAIDGSDEVVDCSTSGITFPTAPFLPGVSWTGRCTKNSLSPSVYERLLYHGNTTRLWHRPFLHIKQYTSLRSGFATSHRGRRLKHDSWRLVLSLWQRSVVSLTRRNSVHVMKKEKPWKSRLHNTAWKRN